MSTRFSHKQFPFLPTALLVTVATVSGCALQGPVQYSDMQSIALCKESKQAQQTEAKITAEYGFRRFAENTYRPVLEYRLFGHEVRVIELNPTNNKLYVAGSPPELGYNFKALLPSIVCENNTCQAPLGDSRTLSIYKFKNKKAKDTTVVECSKPLRAPE